MKILMLIIAFAGGTLLSAAFYFISKWVLKRCPDKYFVASSTRAIIGIIYLSVLFFVCQKSDYLFFILIGGALGITVPSVLLTVKLLKAANSANEEKRDKDGR